MLGVGDEQSQETSALPICAMNHWGCVGHSMGVTEEQGTWNCYPCPWTHGMSLPSGDGWEGEEEKEALGSSQIDLSHHPFMASSLPSSL